jgi:Carbohydrate family 9 binding domain-like
MKKLFLVCLLMMTNAAYAGGADPVDFKSVYAAEDVRLQTDAGSEFWQGAIPVHAERDNYGKLVAHHRTEIRSRWTKRNLYLLFVCPYEDLYLNPAANTSSETNQLWNWDVAELFIAPNRGNIRRYKEFEVSPQGEWIDLDINLDLPDHTVGWTWNSKFEVTARVDSSKKVWYAAMRIPISSFDQELPEAGRIYRANLFRSQGPPDKRRSIAWKAPMAETFHTPEMFGRLVFVAKNDGSK